MYTLQYSLPLLKSLIQKQVYEKNFLQQNNQNSVTEYMDKYYSSRCFDELIYHHLENS